MRGYIFAAFWLYQYLKRHLYSTIVTLNTTFRRCCNSQYCPQCSVYKKFVFTGFYLELVVFHDVEKLKLWKIFGQSSVPFSQVVVCKIPTCECNLTIRSAVDKLCIVMYAPVHVFIEN